MCWAACVDGDGVFAHAAAVLGLAGDEFVYLGMYSGSEVAHGITYSS